MKPLADKAAAMALGPGTQNTGMPAACAASTSRAPGSLTAGMPASLTRATVSPCSLMRAMTWAAFSRSLCW